METTEKIVESYCRYVKGWFTIPNIKCAGQLEIDLVAVQPLPDDSFRRYHIESGISISGSYSKLTAKPYSTDKLKEREQNAGQRRTLGYFTERKFGSPEVIEELKRFGFSNGTYEKIIVTWGWQDAAKTQADREGIILWDFRSILKEIAALCREKKTYFTDDTLRTIQLLMRTETVKK